MSESWSLPGYDVQMLLGSGSAGELWRAVDVATGEIVALQRLTGEADPAALRSAASVLDSLATPYVVRLRSVVASGSGTVLVLGDATGGSLAALLNRRRRLEPGEVVTVAVPLARALAAAHARGLVHGGPTPADVLFTGDGMPLLSGWWPLRLAQEGGAAHDVRALGELCRQMLTGAPSVPDLLADGSVTSRVLRAPDVPPALVRAVEAALVLDPAARPDAAAFAGLLCRAHPPAPVHLTGERATHRPLPGSEVRPAAAPRVGAAARVPQGLLVAAGVLALLVAGGTAGWLSGRGAGPAPPALPARGAVPAVGVTAASPAASTATTTPPTAADTGAAAVAATAPDWAELLDVLDALRAQAFSSGRTAVLSEVYAAGSAGLAADTALLQGLVDRGQSAHGLRHAVRSVQVLQQTASTARLRVEDVLAAYEVQDRHGTVLHRPAGRGEQSFLVRLARTDGRWRIVDVGPAD